MQPTKPPARHQLNVDIFEECKGGAIGIDNLTVYKGENIKRSDNDGAADLTFAPSKVAFQHDESDSSSSEGSISDADVSPPAQQLEKKYIVYQSCLDCLCRERGKPVSEMLTHGSMVGYKISCLGNCSYIWRSQPQKNKLAEENLLITFAIVLTGYIFGRTSEFSSALNLQLFSQSTFSNIQKEHVFPVVQQAWRAEKTAVVEMFRK